ncbi:MAG: hypothetical protein WDZ59_01640 [Pirellulales bacterium]
MQIGESLLYWSVRLALLLYAASVVLQLGGSGDAARRTARHCWSLGCGAFLVHVVAAFGYVHHWSHASAYQSTAEQTAQRLGWDWGGGIYFNYAFTVLWLADVVRWWVAPQYVPPRWYIVGLHTFFILMIFNATVVFGSPVAAWLGGVVLAALTAAAIFRVASQRRTVVPQS